METLGSHEVLPLVIERLGFRNVIKVRFTLPCNRSTVLLETMKVTLKLEDELCREARHKAVDVGMSLSGWITELLKRELSKPENGKDGVSLLDLVGCEDERDFEFPRSNDQPREVDFSWMAIRTRSSADCLLAGTALLHSLTLVTRNESDFSDTGVAVLNPWK